MLNWIELRDVEWQKNWRTKYCPGQLERDCDTAQYSFNLSKITKCVISDDMIDLDEMELDDSLMGQTDQLESVLARLRQEDEAAVSSRNATRGGNLPRTPSPRRSTRRSRSPTDDQPDKRAKPMFEGEFLNTMSGMFKQMTDTFKFQQEERDQWRKVNSTKLAPVESSTANATSDLPIMIDWSDYDIRDDATTVVDMELRNALRPLNVKPETYWKKFDRVAKPCLESIENSHISHIMVNPKVVLKMHDRLVR